MSAIAGEAQVATKTIYLAIETKSGILRALWNLRIRGDEDETPVAARSWYRAVLDEPDPERQLRLTARNSRMVKIRIGTVVEVIRGAALLDADIQSLWDRIQSEFRDNQRAIIKSLKDKNALNPQLELASRFHTIEPVACRSGHQRPKTQPLGPWVFWRSAGRASLRVISIPRALRSFSSIRRLRERGG
jgi:hypothetical protein